jgi:hypothetical protein
MPRRGVLAIAGVVLAARLAALPWPGTGDMDVWKVWSYGASEDPLGVYGLGGTPPERRLLTYERTSLPVDYPPLAMYESALVGTVYRALFPDFPNDWRLNVAVKLPGLFAGLALTAGLFWSVARLTGRAAAGEMAALAVWANPATILNAEVLGYLDPLMMLPSVMALACLHLDAPILAGALMAAGLLTKPQALLVGPAFLVAAWHTGGRRHITIAGITGAAWLVVGALPYLLVGALPNMLQAFGSWQARRDIVSGNAANVWWIATWLARGYNMIPDRGFPSAYFQEVRRILAISSWTEMGLPNPRPIGTALVLAALAWAVWRTWRSPRPAVHFAFAAFTVQAFFVLGVSVHEQHLMLAVPLLGVAAALDATFWGVLVAVSLVCALNLNVFYGLGRGLGWALPRMVTPIDISVLLALASVATLIWHGRVLARAAHVARP